MPEPSATRRVHLLVGGVGAVRFGIDLDSVGGILEHDQLPAHPRTVNVPRLVGGDETDDEHDRYAAVPAAGADAHLRLGASTKVVSVPADRLEPVPPVLRRTSARWAWGGLYREDDHVVLVLDAPRLATLGARTPPSEVRS